MMIEKPARVRIFSGLSTIVTLVTAIGISFNPSACAYTAPASRALQRGHVFLAMAFLDFLEVTFQLPSSFAHRSCFIVSPSFAATLAIAFRNIVISFKCRFLSFAAIGADESIHLGFSPNALQ